MSSEDLIRLKAIDKARREIQEKTALAIEARHKNDVEQAQKHEMVMQKQEERIQRLSQERSTMRDEIKRQRDIGDVQRRDRQLKVAEERLRREHQKAAVTISEYEKAQLIKERKEKELHAIIKLQDEARRITGERDGQRSAEEQAQEAVPAETA